MSRSAWQTVEVRDAEHGPVVVQVAWTLVQARTEGRACDVAELLVIFRERQADGSWKHDYLLSNAALDTPMAEFARLFKAEHRIEECLQRAKGQGPSGLGGLPAADVGRMAPSPNLVIDCHLVPDAGDQAGKKSRHRR